MFSQIKDSRKLREFNFFCLEFLLKNKKTTEAELEGIQDQVKEIVKVAADFSQESPEPEPFELYTDVLIEA